MREIVTKNNRFVIREAAAEDAVSLNEFLRSIISETNHFGFEIEEFTITDEQQAYTINMYSKADNAIMLVATMDGKIVGNLAFRGGSSKKFRHTGEFGVQVSKACWNMGIGREFIKYLIDWTKENEVIHKLSLRVRADNQNAIHLYKKMGFIQEGILRGEMLCDGVMYDLVYMGLLIK